MSAQPQKAPPLTKEEVMVLLNLIETYPVLVSKVTNATNNQLKEATWIKLTARFNSMIESYPRTPEQLRLKWENLKKAARKRMKIKNCNLKTGGGRPTFVPPDKALDKVVSILRSNCGNSVPFGGDAKIEDVVDPTAEKSTLHTPPPSKKIILSSANSNGNLNRLATASSVMAKNQAIADYYKAKNKREEKMAMLKTKILELQILALEKNICPDPLDNNSDCE